MRRKAPWKFAVAMTLVAVVGAACGSNNAGTGAQGDSQQSSEQQPSEPDYQQTYSQVRESYHHMFETADGLAGAIAKQKNLGEVSSPAIDTRATLGRQLGEHAVLAAFAMQKGLDGAPDFEAAAEALNGNTEDLTATITSVYGEEAGNAFNKQWSDHIRMFVDFTVGTASGDQAKREGALRELGQYKQSFGKFLSEGTGLDKAAGLKADDVAALLQSHVDQLTKALDTYKAKDYTATYAQIREAYAHMFMTGDGLSAAIAKQKNLGDTTAGAADTRLTLDRLLGEHALLAVFAMQKGATGSADFEAIGAALSQNTDDLTKVIGSVYGAEAADAFNKQWSDHIRMFVDFTVGTASDDDAKREAALNELGQYKESFGKFLSEGTGLDKDAGLKADAVSGLLQSHVDQLTKALDSYLGYQA
jgi:hypothetical protein